MNDPKHYTANDYTAINTEPIQTFTAFLGQFNSSSIYLQDCTPDEIQKKL